MSRTLGRILLASAVAFLVFGSSAASAAGCDETISLSCTGLVPPPEPAPAPAPAPAPQPEPEPKPAPEPEPKPAPAPAPAPEPEPAPTDAQAVARLRSLIDAERRSHGLGALTLRSALSDVASGHSRNMAGRGEIWHNDDLFTPATKARLGIRLVGENVASNTSIDDAHRRLMASAGHRANLLSTSFTQLGLGVARAGNTWYITEVFATPVASAAPAGAAATPARPSSPTTQRPAATARPQGEAPATTAAPAPPTSEAPADAGPVAVEIEVAAPAELGSSGPIAPAPVRPSSSSAAALVAAVALLVVIAVTVSVPDVRRALVVRTAAAWPTVRAGARRLHLARAVVGLRPRRLGAR